MMNAAAILRRPKFIIHHSSLIIRCQGKHHLHARGAIGLAVGEDFETAEDLRHARVAGRIAAVALDPVQGGGQLDQPATDTQEFAIHPLLQSVGG
jgi:hypothetical protein